MFSLLPLSSSLNERVLARGTQGSVLQIQHPVEVPSCWLGSKQRGPGLLVRPSLLQVLRVGSMQGLMGRHKELLRAVMGEVSSVLQLHQPHCLSPLPRAQCWCSAEALSRISKSRAAPFPTVK